jgi:hypothetical protein
MKTTFDAIILKYSTKWMQHLHPIRNLITCRWLVVYYVLFFSIALKKVCLFIGLFQENLALADVYEHASNQVTTHNSQALCKFKSDEGSPAYKELFKVQAPSKHIFLFSSACRCPFQSSARFSHRGSASDVCDLSYKVKCLNYSSYDAFSTSLLTVM